MTQAFPPRPAAAPALAAAAWAWLLLLVPAAPRAAGPGSEAESLRAQISVLEQRVEQLERQLAELLPAAGTSSAPTQSAAHSGTPPAPIAPPLRAREAGPDITLGGRIRADAIFNSNSSARGSETNRSDLTFLLSAIPLAGSGEQEQFNFNARESRLWVTAHVPTEYGELGGYVEMDFFSSETSGNEKAAGSYTPRLRHAYASYAGFTAGQTWSTFMNASAFPDLNDTGGPPGLVAVRQPQIRYGRDHPWGHWYLALEQPETTLTTTTGQRIGTDDEHLPDFIGKLEFQQEWGNWSIAAMARELRSVDGARDLEDAVWGGAVSAAGRINVFDTDNIRFSLSYGNALGRYLSWNFLDDGALRDDGTIETTEITGGYLAYQHWWTPRLRSNLVLGYIRAWNDLSIVPATVNRSAYASHANLLWSPTPNTSLGLEWIHARRLQEDGAHGTLDRLQFTSMFKF